MIPITMPFFGPEELEAVQNPLKTGWVVQGPEVAAFEGRFAEYTGATHAAATTSCTTALHLAVAALGLKPGDEVLVPAFTWVSTANVVEYMGARPVFVDVDLDTFNIDPVAAADAITERTVGMIPVHLFGLAAEMDPLLSLAKKHDLWVVEDAACAFGTYYHGKHAGTLSDAGCFSFHPRKSITTGEGGMVTTQREDLDRLVRSLRDHGATRSDLERHGKSGAFLLADYPHLGYNFRMTDLQGAVGRVQMERADWILGERRRRAAIYDERLRDLDWLQTPLVPEGHVHGYQAYVCTFRPEEPTLDNVDQLRAERDRVMTTMEGQGIATRQGTHAAALQEFYAKRYETSAGQFPNAHLADRLTLALPLFPQMTDEQQETVIRSLGAAYEAK